MDIVERLRLASSKAKRNEMTIGEYWNLCDESADEIKRLRLQLENAALASVQHEQEWRKAERGLAKANSMEGRACWVDGCQNLAQRCDAHAFGEGAENAAKYAQEIMRLERERDALLRGEFICRKCGLRKDGEHEPAEF